MEQNTSFKIKMKQKIFINLSQSGVKIKIVIQSIFSLLLFHYFNFYSYEWKIRQIFLSLLNWNVYQMLRSLFKSECNNERLIHFNLCLLLDYIVKISHNNYFTNYYPYNNFKNEYLFIIIIKHLFRNIFNQTLFFFYLKGIMKITC